MEGQQRYSKHYIADLDCILRRWKDETPEAKQTRKAAMVAFIFKAILSTVIGGGLYLCWRIFEDIWL